MSRVDRLRASPTDSLNRYVIFYRQAHLGIPLGGTLFVEDHRDQEHDGASNTGFRQIRAVSYVIPYILCGGLYCLRVLA